MKDYLFPILLSALIFPGAGQIYNKEKGKGWVFMGVFCLAILGLFGALFVALWPLLPHGGPPVPIEHLNGLASQVLNEPGPVLAVFWWLGLLTWSYSILDAYLGARDLAKARRSVEKRTDFPG